MTGFTPYLAMAASIVGCLIFVMGIGAMIKPASKTEGCVGIIFLGAGLWIFFYFIPYMLR